MTDIVQQARDYVALNAAESGTDVLLLAMADEIERLRAIMKETVDELNDMLSGPDGSPKTFRQFLDEAKKQP